MIGEIPRLDATLISLPYVDQCFSFNVLLPKNITGLFYLEAKLSSQNLEQAFQQLKEQYVQLRLPSFEITTSLNLVSGLQNVGQYIKLIKYNVIHFFSSISSALKQLSRLMRTSVL